MTGPGSCERGPPWFPSDHSLLICAWCFMKEQMLSSARSLGPPSGTPTMHPVSRVLLDMNKESFRQDILSVCSLQICINRICDVMPWSSPTYALSVCCANPQRSVRILIMLQGVKLISKPMRRILWKWQGTRWGALQR